MLRNVKSFDLKGQRILLRLDLNVPLNKNNLIEDNFRIRATLPTIKYCLDEGASIVIMSHLGRPDGKENDKLSLIPIGEELASLLEMPIKFSNNCISQDSIDTSLSLKDGEIHLLENLRFHSGEVNNDSDFSNKLSRHGRIFINDSFGTIHRKHASNFGVINYFKNYGIGFLMGKELRYQKELMIKPNRPLVLLLGGAKISTKVKILEKYINKADNIIIGGGMAFTFFKAMGYNIGKSVIESSMIDKAKSIIKLSRMLNKELLFPLDLICSNSIDSSPFEDPVSFRKISDDMIGLDIGPKTIKKIKNIIESAETVIWNGPLGFFEKEEFSNGTKEIAFFLRDLSKNKINVVAGGGDTASALSLYECIDDFTHVSTGGGASLSLLSGKRLNSLERLEI